MINVNVDVGRGCMFFFQVSGWGGFLSISSIIVAIFMHASLKVLKFWLTTFFRCSWYTSLMDLWPLFWYVLLCFSCTFAYSAFFVLVVVPVTALHNCSGPFSCEFVDIFSPPSRSLFFSSSRFIPFLYLLISWFIVPSKSRRSISIVCVHSVLCSRLYFYFHFLGCRFLGGSWFLLRVWLWALCMIPWSLLFVYSWIVGSLLWIG